MSVPELVCRIGESCAFSDAGVVYENVDVTIKACAHMFKHFLNARTIGDIADKGKRVGTACASDFLSNPVDLFECARSNSHACTFICEGKCNRATDATSPAGDQCCFVFEKHRDDFQD